MPSELLKPILVQAGNLHALAAHPALRNVFRGDTLSAARLGDAVTRQRKEEAEGHNEAVEAFYTARWKRSDFACPPPLPKLKIVHVLELEVRVGGFEAYQERMRQVCYGSGSKKLEEAEKVYDEVVQDMTGVRAVHRFCMDLKVGAAWVLGLADVSFSYAVPYTDSMFKRIVFA